MTTKANPPRKSQATVALLDAYNRLRDGKGTATNGKLSITNVAREAGVSRATAYRCSKLLALFDEAPKPPKAKPQSTSGKAERGLYHATYTGSYVMQNDGGEIVIGEGDFGFVRDSKSSPVELPKDPGLNLDELPFMLTGDKSDRGGRCDVR